MQHIYKRREAIKIGLGSLAGLSTLGLAACENTLTSPASTPQHIAMQLLFWGTKTRNTLTKNAIDVFQQRFTGISINSQYTTAYNSYWPLLDRLIAAGHIPDLLQMDMRYVAKYARSRLMLDLTPLIYEQTIVLSDFDPIMLDASKANNAIYGIPMGGNYECLIYNTVLLASSGVGALPAAWTWETFAESMVRITQGLPKGVYGCSDASGGFTVFESWMRQRGKELYTVDGQLAFTAQDVMEWFDYWNRLRARGGCITAQMQAAINKAAPASESSVANSALVRGEAVFGMSHTDSFESFQAAVNHPLAFAFLPDGPGGSVGGLYYKPSLLLSISAQAPDVNSAASFINFLLNDPNGIKAIGTERGIPGSRRAQTVLASTLTPPQKQEVAFVNAVSQSGKARLKEVLDPPAASQVATLFAQTALDIALKHTSVSNGAQSFYTAAQKALA